MRPKKKPTLTVSILTKNSENRLERLLSEVACFADQIVVGVDASSTDGTLAIATRLADVVFRFEVPGMIAPARRFVSDYATSDWILSLDDDESIEDEFDRILPELLSDTRIDYVLFPRKWVVCLDPPEYLHDPRWYPDWQVRLFRNDPTRIYKPQILHSGYWIQGTPRYETRASILHFEPVFCSPEERARKLERYRKLGSTTENDAFYEYAPEIPRRHVRLREGRSSLKRWFHRPLVHKDVRKAGKFKSPWRCKIRVIEMSQRARVGEVLLVELAALNTGDQIWTPFWGRFPKLRLGYRLLDGDGKLIQKDAGRVPVQHPTAIGEEHRFLFSFAAPSEVGNYILEWDMVSESERWFGGEGGKTLRTSLTIHQ